MPPGVIVTTRNTGRAASGAYSAPTILDKSSWGASGATVTAGTLDQSGWADSLGTGSDPNGILSAGTDGRLRRLLKVGTDSNAINVSSNWTLPSGPYAGTLYVQWRCVQDVLNTSNEKFGRVMSNGTSVGGNALSNTWGTMLDRETGSDGNPTAHVGSHYTLTSSEPETRFGLGLFLAKRLPYWDGQGCPTYCEDLLGVEWLLTAKLWMDASYFYAQHWVYVPSRGSTATAIIMPYNLTSPGIARIWDGNPASFDTRWVDPGVTGEPTIYRWVRTSTTTTPWSGFGWVPQLNAPQSVAGYADLLRVRFSTSMIDPTGAI